MAIEAHILGTSSARPTATRAVSGSIVVTDEGNFVVDAGEGFQSRFAQQRKWLKQYDAESSIRPSKIKAIFLTHGHLDHTWGVLPWLQSMSLDGRTQPLAIIGPTTSAVVEALVDGVIPEDVLSVDLYNQFGYWISMVNHEQPLPYELTYILGDPTSRRWVQLDTKGHGKLLDKSFSERLGLSTIEIEAFPTLHSVPSCAWSITQQQRLGAFDRNRAGELQLDEHQKSALSAGHDIEHEGTMLLASTFRGPPKPALRLVVSGDTAECSPSLASIESCNVLIHEATFIDEQQDVADAFLHSTSRGAMKTARSMNAQALCLTHYSNRLSETDVLIQEAEAECPDIVVTAADDHDRIYVDDSGEVVHKYWNGNGWMN
ncbi:MAG: MBL fold metallo-hydrolase [archaeon]|nr:MBL fold metallo-hydrolase [archaeon]MDA1168017.1 MBL fold metallo-hydrolase [archaeon]